MAKRKMLTGVLCDNDIGVAIVERIDGGIIGLTKDMQRDKLSPIRSKTEKHWAVKQKTPFSPHN